MSNSAIAFIKEMGLEAKFNEWKSSHKEDSSFDFGVLENPITDWSKLIEGKYYYTGEFPGNDWQCKIEIEAWQYAWDHLHLGGYYESPCLYSKFYEISEEKFDAYSEYFYKYVEHRKTKPTKKRKK